MTCDQLKRQGAEHYKTGDVEPVDLMRSLGAFQSFALCNIIKYAARNVRRDQVSQSDMDKIIDYAEKLKAEK